MGKNPQRIARIRLDINQFNWKETNFLSEAKERTMFETYNKSTIHNVLLAPINKKKIKQACISNHDLEYLIEVILLMIKDGENWYYLTVINLPKQLEGTTSKK